MGKVYDCFLFNDEIDLLEIRLDLLFNHVDFFVIAESNQTFTSLPKPLHYKINQDRFKKYTDKIIYLQLPANIPNVNAWDNEYFQRNCLKLPLSKCSNSDIIMISDVDEIINPQEIKLRLIIKPCLVQLYYYYYYFNLKSLVYNQVVLVSPYSFIKNFNIGKRISYELLNPEIIKCTEKHTGWHFSYLFGNNIERYITKINSFSHQEFNNDYYKNPNRIRSILKYGIDFFERKDTRFFYVKPAKELIGIFQNLDKYKDLIFYKPSALSIKSKKDFYYYILYLKNLLRIGIKTTRG